ncbi:MAG: hypothetical protein ACPGUC_09945, partial [Gammaproteobacteria bacterium]
AETVAETAPTDVRELRRGIDALRSPLFEECLVRTFDTTDIDQTLECIAALIDADNVGGKEIRRRFNHAVSDFCTQASREQEKELVAVWLFCVLVVVQFAKVAENLGQSRSDKDSEHYAVGTNRSYALTFLVDRSLGLRRHEGLRANKGGLIDEPEYTGVITIEPPDDPGAMEAHERAYQVVQSLAKQIVLESRCPAYSERFGKTGDTASLNYLRDVDEQLEARLDGPNYFLLRADAFVPSEVIEFLRRWLPHLLVFRYHATDGAVCNLMVGSPGTWGAWLAEVQGMIDIRLESFRPKGIAALLTNGASDGPTDSADGSGWNVAGLLAQGSGRVLDQALHKVDWATKVLERVRRFLPADEPTALPSPVADDKKDESDDDR